MLSKLTLEHPIRSWNRNSVKPPAMYDVRPESKEDVSVTEERNGNKPVKSLLVEMEAELNAGHAVESRSGMQSCALASEALQTSKAQREVEVDRFDRRDLRGRGCDVELRVCISESPASSIGILVVPLVVFVSRSRRLSQQYCDMFTSSIVFWNLDSKDRRCDLTVRRCQRRQPSNQRSELDSVEDRQSSSLSNVVGCLAVVSSRDAPPYGLRSDVA